MAPEARGTRNPIARRGRAAALVKDPLLPLVTVGYGEPNHLIPRDFKKFVRVLKCCPCHPPHGFGVMPEKNFLQRGNRPPRRAPRQACICMVECTVYGLVNQAHELWISQIIPARHIRPTSQHGELVGISHQKLHELRLRPRSKKSRDIGWHRIHSDFCKSGSGYHLKFTVIPNAKFSPHCDLFLTIGVFDMHQAYLRASMAAFRRSFTGRHWPQMADLADHATANESLAPRT
jgi:hypothetical protein